MNDYSAKRKVQRQKLVDKGLVYRKRSERPSCKDAPMDGGANHGKIETVRMEADGSEIVRCPDCMREIRIGPQGQLSFVRSWNGPQA